MNTESFRVRSLQRGNKQMDVQQNPQPQAAPAPVAGHVIDLGSSSGHQEASIPKETLKVLLEEAAAHAEEEGDFRRANKIRGIRYEPTAIDTTKSVLVKVKNAMITVGIALAPLGGVWLFYQGIRLLIPAARKWPALGIKYTEQNDKKQIVRLAPVPKAASTP